MSDNKPIYGCNGCATSAGRMGCSIHGSAPVFITTQPSLMSPGPQIMWPDERDQEIASLRKQLSESEEKRISAEKGCENMGVALTEVHEAECSLAAWSYQLASIAGCPVEVLDALSAIANIEDPKMEAKDFPAASSPEIDKLTAEVATLKRELERATGCESSIEEVFMVLNEAGVSSTGERTGPQTVQWLGAAERVKTVIAERDQLRQALGELLKQVLTVCPDDTSIVEYVGSLRVHLTQEQVAGMQKYKQIKELRQALEAAKGLMHRLPQIGFDAVRLPAFSLDDSGGCDGCETGWCQSAVDAICEGRNQFKARIEAEINAALARIESLTPSVSSETDPAVQSLDSQQDSTSDTQGGQS